MELLTDPQAWLSFVTLALLEIVLGIDNIIFLAILVERLPRPQRASARLLGLSLAMVTRIALLFSVTWLASLRAPLFAVAGREVSGRNLVLAGGGAFLVVQSLLELRNLLAGRAHERQPGFMNSFGLIIVQIGIIDIAFSVDSVFTAVGLANRIEIMVAAIVAAVLVMMVVSAAISAFLDAQPTLKVLALAFLLVVGGALLAEAADWDFPKGYLYFAMGFAAVVEWLNIRLRRAPAPQPTQID